MAQSLMQLSQVRGKTAQHYEEDEPESSKAPVFQHNEEEEAQSSTGPVLMQGSSAANTAASAEGMPLMQPRVDKITNDEDVALREQSGVVDTSVNIKYPNADWHTRWHSWLLASQNKKFVLAELGSRTLQAVQAFCHQTMSRVSTASLTSMWLILRQAAARGTMGSWGWVVLALGLGIVLIAIIVSLGRVKQLDHRDFPIDRGSIRPPYIDRPRPSAKFGPRSSVKMGQHASTLGGGGPRGSMMPGGGTGEGYAVQKEISEQSLGPAESYDVNVFARGWGKTGARSSQHVTAGSASTLSRARLSATPERPLWDAASDKSPMSMHRSKLDVGTCLCPELVVPASCECNLRVPAQVGVGNAIDVTDMNGYDVMRNILLKQGGQRQILLTTGSGDILAKCIPAPGTCGEFHLLRAHGEYFGKLVQASAPDEYSIQTASGAELTMKGSGHTLKITDPWGKLLAMTEPETRDTASSSRNEAYLLRVAPLMDVSIVMCSLLIVTHLM